MSITAPLLINGGGQIEIAGVIAVSSGASITVASGTTLVSESFGAFVIAGGDLNMDGHFFLENGGLILNDGGRIVIQNGGLLDGNGGGNTLTVNDGAEIRIKPGGTLSPELIVTTNGTGRVVNEGNILIPAGGNAEFGAGSSSGAIAVETGGTLELGNFALESGSTLENNGTLVFNGDATSADPLVLGGVIGGSGVLTTPEVTLSGTVSPGNSPGTLTVVGNVVFTPDSLLEFQLGTVSDLLVVNGDLVLDGILNVFDSSGFGLGTYVLIDYAGTLTDNGLSLGELPGGFDYTIENDAANTRISLVVAPIPEPGGGVLILGGLAMLAAWRRR